MKHIDLPMLTEKNKCPKNGNNPCHCEFAYAGMAIQIDKLKT